jgi:virulence-associated protein VagC
MKVIEHFQVTLDYEVAVDEETGEVTTNLIKKSIDKAKFKSVEIKEKKTKKKDESNQPMLILEEKKYRLNTAAVELMGVNPDDKLDIKYEQNGKVRTPVIGTDEVFGTKSGNRVTKTFTVSCRGSKQEELSSHGTEFIIEPHPTKENLFILKSTEENISEAIEDDTVEIPLDDELQDIIDDPDTTEIDSSIFNFNL